MIFIFRSGKLEKSLGRFLSKAPQKNQLNELVQNIAQSKDQASFIKLFDACSGQLKAYAMRCGASDHDAEEIVQEAMATVWNKAHQFNPNTASAITWLYTIVRNKRIDFARKNKHNQILSEDLWPNYESDQRSEDQLYGEDYEKDAEQQFEDDLNAKMVRTMITSLPQEQRQMVYMVYFEGKSHSEIADETGLPLGTIKSRLRLAMKKLDTLAKEQSSWLIIILLMNY